MMRLPRRQDFAVPITTASIVMLDIRTEETTDVLMVVIIAIVTFLVFLDQKCIVWTVKEYFVVETVLQSINLSNLSSINLFVNLCIIVVNVILGLWAIRKTMYAQDRENVGMVKRLLDQIINAIFKVMNVNLR